MARQCQGLREFVEGEMALRRADRRDQQHARRASGMPCLFEFGVGVELLIVGAGHRDRPRRRLVADAVRRRQREHAVAAFQQRGQSDEVGGRNAVEYQRAVRFRIRAHVLQRIGFGVAFEALEERHVAGEVRRVIVGKSAAAVHARQVVHAFLALGAHAVADDMPRFQHARDFFVGAFEYGAARVAHDGVERIAEAVGV